MRLSGRSTFSGRIAPAFRLVGAGPVAGRSATGGGGCGCSICLPATLPLAGREEAGRQIGSVLRNSGPELHGYVLSVAGSLIGRGLTFWVPSKRRLRRLKRPVMVSLSGLCAGSAVPGVGLVSS